jgi:ligand-binding sensor domain-containing protein
LFQFDVRQHTFFHEFVKPGVYETVNVITDVVNDKAGNLWILTDYGAWFYPQGNPEKKVYLLPDTENDKSLSTHALKKGLCDKAGNIWIGSWQGGVNIRYAEPERFSSFQHQIHNPQSLLSERVTAVAYDRTGQLWVSSIKGLTSVSADRKRFQRFTTANSPLAANDINTLMTTPKGNVLSALGRLVLHCTNQIISSLRHYLLEKVNQSRLLLKLLLVKYGLEPMNVNSINWTSRPNECL